MIIYFADRQMNILGNASTGLPGGMSVFDDVKCEEIETGVASFECRISFKGKTYETADRCTAVGNYLLRSHNGENEFYTIIEREKDAKKQEVYLYAEDAGLDLLNEIIGPYEADQAYPIDYYIEKFACDSGFEIGINEVSGLTRKLSWDGESTKTERIASVATQFDGCEISYSFSVDGLEVTHKYINIFKKRGKDAGCVLRMNAAVDGIVINESIANLATALKCSGGTPEDSDKPITLNGYAYDDGDFFVEGMYLKSRKALEKWTRHQWMKEPGQGTGTGHLERPYSYDTTSQKELCAHAVTELKKRCEVEVNYEVDISRLPEDVNVGDRITIVNDDMDTYVEGRLLKLETSVADNTRTAVLGEYLLKQSGLSKKVEELAAEFTTSNIIVEKTRKIAVDSKNEASKACVRADASAKTATNYIDSDIEENVQIGNKTSGSWKGFRTMIRKSTFDILNTAGEVVASYGAKLIELGKNAADAVIRLCGGKGEIRYDDDNQSLDLTGPRIRFKGTEYTCIEGRYVSEEELTNVASKIILSKDGMTMDIEGFGSYTNASGWLYPIKSTMHLSKDEFKVFANGNSFLLTENGAEIEYLRYPINMHAMTVYGSSALTLSTAIKKVICGNTLTECSDFLESVDGGVKCLRQGYVLVFGFVYYKSLTAGDTVGLSVYKNTTVCGAQRTASSAAAVSAHIPVEIIPVSANDVIYMYAQNYTGARGSVSSGTSTTMTVMYIG